MGRRARVTREQVLKAAREAFGEAGFDGTTLAVIAARLGVSPAALLRHAPTKEALFGAAMASAAPADLRLPLEFLDSLEGTEDPAAVLRRVAERAIPVLEATFDTTIVAWLHSRRPGAPPSIRLPFDPRSKSTPPQRAFRAIEGYLEKAVRAGRVRVDSPRSAATAFMGALFAYVSFHKLLRVLDPPLPLDRYLDTLIDLWKKGAIVSAPARRPPRPRKRGERRSR